MIRWCPNMNRLRRCRCRYLQIFAEPSAKREVHVMHNVQFLESVSAKKLNGKERNPTGFVTFNYHRPREYKISYNPLLALMATHVAHLRSPIFWGESRLAPHEGYNFYGLFSRRCGPIRCLLFDTMILPSERWADDRRIRYHRYRE